MTNNLRDPALEALSRQVLTASFAVHTELGPGLLESAYEACLAFELASTGLFVERQKVLPVHYRGTVIDAGYRLDLLVERALLIEVKAVNALAPIHLAQVLTYLKLSGLRLGLMLNFNVPHLRQGIRRVVCDLE